MNNNKEERNAQQDTTTNQQTEKLDPELDPYEHEDAMEYERRLKQVITKRIEQQQTHKK